MIVRYVNLCEQRNEKTYRERAFSVADYHKTAELTSFFSVGLGINFGGGAHCTLTQAPLSTQPPQIPEVQIVVQRKVKCPKTKGFLNFGGGGSLVMSFSVK